MTALDLPELRLAQNTVAEGYAFWFGDLEIAPEHEIELGVFGTSEAPSPEAVERLKELLKSLPELEQQARLMLPIVGERGAKWWLSGIELYAPHRDPLQAEYALSYVREDMPAAVEAVGYYVGFIGLRPLYVVFRYE